MFFLPLEVQEKEGFFLITVALDSMDVPPARKSNQTNTHTKIVGIKLQIFKSLRRGFEIREKRVAKDDELDVISPFCNVLSRLDLQLT